jgi:Na+(H+)/acetate symporter ActP
VISFAVELLPVCLFTVLSVVAGAVRVAGRAARGGGWRLSVWRPSRTTGDLLVASRSVTPLWNASAISGEYISAAAFLGTAGLVLIYGADILWLPIGAAAGYLVLQAFVTAPLRRSGAYTLSDFAEWRFGSRPVRHSVSVCVCFVGWFYLLPQFQGAGVTLRVVAGLPAWVGWASVVAVVLTVVLLGGMRSITVIQAFQFWLKLVAVAVPLLALVAVWRLDGAPDPAQPTLPTFVRETAVGVDADIMVRAPLDEAAQITGVVDGRRYGGQWATLTAGPHSVREGTRLVFPAGAAVPHAARLPVQRGDTWADPLGPDTPHPLFATYSALVGMLLGTMGLPHVVVRFYTSTCGRAARRTAATVPLLLALFYLFPTLYGALGRLYTPELLMTGDGDATILVLPQRLIPGLPGTFLTGLLAAGAFTAFTSTSCGIAVAVGGTISQCLLRGGVRAFRAGVLTAVAVPLSLVLWIGPLGSASLVTLAFAVSACSLCPLLVLGVWWRRFTSAGAVAGVAMGCVLAVVAALSQIFVGPQEGWWGALLREPSIAIVPVTFGVMVLVSLLTPGRVPLSADKAMARLHLPEEPALDRSR